MEENTVVLSLERYEQLTAFEREVMNGKVIAIQEIIILQTTSYSMQNGSKVYFFTESEVVDKLTNEIIKLREQDKERDIKYRQKYSKILEDLYQIKKKRWGKSSGVNKMIAKFWKY